MRARRTPGRGKELFIGRRYPVPGPDGSARHPGRSPMKERRQRIAVAVATTSGAAMIFRHCPDDEEPKPPTPTRRLGRRRASEPPREAPAEERREP